MKDKQPVKVTEKDLRREPICIDIDSFLVMDRLEREESMRKMMADNLKSVEKMDRERSRIYIEEDIDKMSDDDIKYLNKIADDYAKGLEKMVTNTSPSDVKKRTDDSLKDLNELIETFKVEANRIIEEVVRLTKEIQ